MKYNHPHFEIIDSSIKAEYFNSGCFGMCVKHWFDPNTMTLKLERENLRNFYSSEKKRNQIVFPTGLEITVPKPWKIKYMVDLGNEFVNLSSNFRTLTFVNIYDISLIPDIQLYL